MGTAHKRYSRKAAAILTVLAMVLALFPIAAFAAGFPDVSGVLAKEINAAADAELVSGYDDGTFRPNQNVTRAQFAKMIVRAVEKATGKALEKGDEPFSDVTPNQALYEYVVKAYKAGYIKGYSDGTFGYDKEINRQEAAAILQRALNLPAAKENFEDVPDNSDFADEIGAVAAAGIMKGYLDGKNFGPGDKLTRGQAAATAYRGYGYLLPFKVASVALVNSKQLQISFTQPVDKSTVIDANDGTLVNGTFQFQSLDNVNVTADTAAAELSADGKVLTITAAGTEYFDGRYAVTIKSTVKSTAGKELEAYSAVHNLDDSTRPTVVSIAVNVNGEVTITFSEPVKGANDSNAYHVTLDGATQTITGLQYVNNSKDTKVTFSIQNVQRGKTYSVSINGTVQDYAGNLISPNPTTLTVTVSDDQTKPTVTAIEALDLNTLKITFSEPVDTTLTPQVKIDDGTAAALTNLQWSTDKTQVTGDISPVLAGVHRVEVSNYKDLAGNVGDAVSKFVTFAEDKTAPKVASVSVATISGKRHIVVVFNEAVDLVTPVTDLTASYVADNILYEDQTIPASAVSGYDSDGDGKDDAVKIQAIRNKQGGGTEDMPSGEWTIQLPQGFVQDKSDNKNKNAATSIKVTLGGTNDTTKPSVLAVSVQPSGKNNIVEVTFSESVTDASALNTANYTVEGKTVFTSAVFLDSGKTKVRLTLADGSITVTGPAVFEIRNVRDTAGNAIDPVKRTETFKENVRPKLTGYKMVNVNKVELTFSENISGLDQADFENVTVAGADASVTAVSVDANKATITLSKSIQGSNDVVKGSIKAGAYTDAAGNSNLAESFEVRLP